MGVVEGIDHQQRCTGRPDCVQRHSRGSRLDHHDRMPQRGDRRRCHDVDVAGEFVGVSAPRQRCGAICAGRRPRVPCGHGAVRHRRNDRNGIRTGRRGQRRRHPVARVGSRCTARRVGAGCCCAGRCDVQRAVRHHDARRVPGVGSSGAAAASAMAVSSASCADRASWKATAKAREEGPRVSDSSSRLRCGS